MARRSGALPSERQMAERMASGYGRQISGFSLNCIAGADRNGPSICTDCVVLGCVDASSLSGVGANVSHDRAR
jgi:hypothetical protein